MGPMTNKLRLSILFLLGCAAVQGATANGLTWSTIASMADPVPGTTVPFNSFNQPSVNESGLVVFRARGKGPGEPPSGIFIRDMQASGPLVTFAARGLTVPVPNNNAATWNEFPSIPRIDATSSAVATRGQSSPVYTYMLPDGTETRVGTSGIYTNAGGTLVTGASLLGAVVEAGVQTFPWYAVPGVVPPTRFDQFPGGPTVTGTTIAFKGNYTDPSDSLGKTGVYYRDVVAAGGQSPVFMIADSAGTIIPNQPAGGTVKFGSTAPPSIANGWMFFVGSDNEDAPTLGGVYRAAMQQPPVLQTLAGIGGRVPTEAAGAGFTRFGEGLSVSGNGRYVSFWAAWGSETSRKTLNCPVDGNAALVAYCNQQHPAGYAVDIPVHQGFFVVDTVTGEMRAVAKTLSDGITDFVYWVYSGAPPGVGDESQEPPRWRSSAFSAVSGNGEGYEVAFKARRNGVDGIYLRPASATLPLVTIVEVATTLGQSIDASAPANSIVSAVGIERDGFRGSHLVVSVSMLYETVEESVGWAGVYKTQIAPAGGCAGFIDVALSSPFCQSVQWMVNRSVTTGCAPGLYCPGETMVRVGLAAFLHRASAALSPTVVQAHATGGALDLDASPALCGTAAFATGTFTRHASITGTVSASSAAAVDVEAALLMSRDGGITWTPVMAVGPRMGIEAGHWKAQRLVGEVDLGVGETVAFAIGLLRAGPGTQDIDASRCSVRAEIANRNGVMPPFDPRSAFAR